MTRVLLSLLAGLLLQNWAVYDGVYYEALRFPASVASVGAGAGNAVDVDLYGRLLFATNQDEEAFFHVQMPHSYVAATNIIPHVHWAKTTSAGGDVVFKLDYDCKDIGETFTGSLGATLTFAYITDDADTADLHARAGHVGFDPAFVGVSGMCMMRLWRDVSEDDYAADVVVHEFDVHYQLDQPGSRAEAVK